LTFIGIQYNVRQPKPVLHAFRKTTAATSRHDVELGRRRYGEMLAHRRERQELDDR
jgi:phage-related protein